MADACWTGNRLLDYQFDDCVLSRIRSMYDKASVIVQVCFLHCVECQHADSLDPVENQVEFGEDFMITSSLIESVASYCLRSVRLP